MSKFFKALEQAQRDRALRTQGERRVGGGGTKVSSGRDPGDGAPATTLDGFDRKDRRPETRDQHESSQDSVGEQIAKRLPVARRRPDLRGKVDDRLVSLVAPAGFEAEQYRALRYAVEQRSKATGPTVLAVSSPGVGDGKTTTALNLAGSLAQASEIRVLLVEADLRRPSVGSLLGYGDMSGPGLVDAILDERAGLAAVTQARPPFNLDVILAGQRPPSPYEVLKSPRLGELLEEARRRYDYVIVDTPPLVQVQDGRVIMRWVDGVLLVVAAHRTPRRLVEEALTAVDSSKMLGLVFNGDSGPFSRYTSRHRGYYSQPASVEKGAGRLGRALRRIGSPFNGGGPAAGRRRKGPSRTS